MRLILLICILLPFTVSGQYDPSPKDPKKKQTAEEFEKDENSMLRKDLLILKLSPLDYFAPATKISADAEFRPHQGRIAYQIGAGLLPNFSVTTALTLNRPWGKLFDHSIGGMLRGQVRVYLKSSKVTYMGANLELDYRFIRTETTLGYEPNGGEPIPEVETVFDLFGWNQFDNVNDTYAYFELKDMNFHRLNAAWGIHVGQARVFKNRFCFEWFAGVSLGMSRVLSVDDFPDDAVIVGTNAATGWNMNTRHILLAPASEAGVRFGWAFDHKPIAPRD